MKKSFASSFRLQQALYGCIVGAAFLLAACNSPVTPPPGTAAVTEPGTGQVRITFTDGAARTIYPAVVYDHYVYTFTWSGEWEGVELTPAGGVFALPAGSWSLVVEAYYTAGDSYPAATSSTTYFTVNDGQLTNITVTLPTPGGGEYGYGGFLYFSITYPAGTTLEILSWEELAYDGMVGGTTDLISYLTLTPSTTGGVTTLTGGMGENSGYYLLTTFLRDAAGKMAGKSEVVHIYDGMDTNAAFTFTGADFTELPENDPGDFMRQVFVPGKITITGYTGAYKTVKIPAVLDGLPVATIGDDAFSGKQLIGVIIPDSVTGIGPRAFSNNYLTGVVVLNSVTEILEDAFRDNLLTGVTLGSSLATIGNSAFRNNQLTGVVIPNSVTSIGEDAFDSNQLTGVTLPNSITTIQPGTFANNKLAALTLPASITTIGEGYSSYNDQRGAFENNEITTLTIPNTITSIGGSAFANNQLASLTLGSSLTTIGSSAFDSNQLTGVVIPNSVTSIGAYAFAFNQLTSVTIPDSVTTIGSSAFLSNQLASVTIPDSVTSIGNAAFMNNQLTGVVIPNSVTTIGSSAFLSNQLTSVTLPNSITTISYGTFANNKLAALTLPASITSIGGAPSSSYPGAFENNEFTTLTIPSTVTSIGARAFLGNYLTSLTIIGAYVTVAENNSFDGPVNTAQTSYYFKPVYQGNDYAAGTYLRNIYNGQWRIPD
jgi:hypothetical protein